MEKVWSIMNIVYAMLTYKISIFGEFRVTLLALYLFTFASIVALHYLFKLIDYLG